MENLLKNREVPQKNLFIPTSKELDLTVFRNCQKVVSGMQIVIHLAGAVGGVDANAKKPGEFFL